MEAEAREAIWQCVERIGWRRGGIWYSVVDGCAELVVWYSEGLEESQLGELHFASSKIHAKHIFRCLNLAAHLASGKT